MGRLSDAETGAGELNKSPNGIAAFPIFYGNDLQPLYILDIDGCQVFCGQI
jgi:hypothetical protein